jgi:hypothetical protein
MIGDELPFRPGGQFINVGGKLLEPQVRRFICGLPGGVKRDCRRLQRRLYALAAGGASGQMIVNADELCWRQPLLPISLDLLW